MGRPRPYLPVKPGLLLLLAQGAACVAGTASCRGAKASRLVVTLGAWCPARFVGAVRPIALPGAGFVPYAGAVPDGGRHGFKAARTVASPHRLAA